MMLHITANGHAGSTKITTAEGNEVRATDLKLSIAKDDSVWVADLTCYPVSFDVTARLNTQIVKCPGCKEQLTGRLALFLTDEEVVALSHLVYGYGAEDEPGRESVKQKVRALRTLVRI